MLDLAAAAHWKVPSNPASPLPSTSPVTRRRLKCGFTLIELLVVIAVIAVLAAILLPVLNMMKQRGNQTASLSNMRQVGAVMLNYAADHDYELPGRATGEEGDDRWPKLIAPYIKDIKIFAAPGDPNNYINRHVDPLSNTSNNTSFIMNGYNDLGMYTDPAMKVRINRITTPSTTLLLGTPKSGSEHFFMDFLEPPHGNQKDVLNLKAYGDGSNYLFADGSARFISAKEYNATEDKLWLVDKDYKIPSL
jgi:prepilin-type N-terminal cleavage/methylation domain-containing protein/prepilin-type processing-associated H-X9-DG protein